MSKTNILPFALLLRQFNGKRKKLDDGTEVRHVGPFLIDIFRGEGFKNQSRYRRTRTGEWVHVSGSIISKEDLTRCVA